MESTAGVSATRGGFLAMPSSRKEWRAVSEHHPARKAVDEELERSSFGLSGERTIYEQGREPLDMDFSSISVNGNSDGDFLQQQLLSISRQREELQQMETDLRAQMIVRSEIAGIQNSFETQLKEHADAVVELQEQLHDKDQVIRESEKKIEEKDRELLVVKRDNEVAWAKEDLLREQKKELATFRRERDHSEAERLQHMKQIHDLQEHLQDKDRQLIEMQDQHRVAQETIIYKDEQLREAQAWITRAQEIDALQSQSLQAELRERTEQCQQLWIGWQRQSMEMERFHLHTVQQLQLELADARERSGSYTGESRMQQISPDPSQFGQDDSNKSDASGPNAKSGALSNGSLDRSSIAPNGNMNDHVAGIPLASSSLLGLPTLIPPGQVAAVHPFVIHQQGGPPQSMPSNIPQVQPSYYQPMPPASTFQELQNAQATAEAHIQIPHSEADQNSVRSSDIKFDHQVAVNGQAPRREYVEISQEVEHDSANHSSDGVESIERSHLFSSKPEQSSKQLSSQFHDSLTLDQNQQNHELEELRALNSNIPEAESQRLAANEPTSVSHNNKESTAKISAGANLSESFNSSGQTSGGLVAAKTLETNLLDERSLLACIVRTIPAGGRIRISSTLPNRLGKMLAPLHWHDYKKKYGKLDDFVGSHPELFVMEGDYIKLREGAQEMIAAKAAVAKVAAAAVASTPYSSNLPSVAVTPMAQTYRSKGIPSSDCAAGGTNMKILSKSKNIPELNGLQSASKTVNNGVSLDRSSLSGKGAANGKPAVKPPGRATGPASASRR